MSDMISRPPIGSPVTALPGQRSAMPLPRVGITVRPGVMSDVPFLDALQKVHTKQVGWMPTKQFEGKIKLGHVIVADDDAKQSVGYCIGHDQYFKRDDVGIIYQMNVLPGRQRGLIGATLLKAMFDRAAYGCRLFCCWCAQDIAANRFWESMGFVPLVFRAGSAQTARVHIFWQKRIRAGDTTTPWWFPSRTAGGSIREDRIVLPIPPGTHWSDAKPLVLPALSVVGGPGGQMGVERGQLPDATLAAASPRAKRSRGVKPVRTVVPARPAGVATGGFWFAAPKLAAPAMEEKPARARREPKQKVKNDPRLVAAARELRDRWLEQVNASPPLARGKYDVSRRLLRDDRGVDEEPVLLLPAA